jgi:hypothetical protein
MFVSPYALSESSKRSNVFSINRLSDNEANSAILHWIGPKLLNRQLIDSSLSILSKTLESEPPIDQLIFATQSGASVRSNSINFVASTFYRISKEQVLHLTNPKYLSLFDFYCC